MILMIDCFDEVWKQYKCQSSIQNCQSSFLENVNIDQIQTNLQGASCNIIKFGYCIQKQKQGMFYFYLASQIYVLITQGEEESLDENELLIPPPDDKSSYAHLLHRTYFQDSYCMDGTKAAAYVFDGNNDDLIMYFYSGGICIEDSTKLLKYGVYAYIDNFTHRNTTFYETNNGYPEEFNANQELMENNKYQNMHLRETHKCSKCIVMVTCGINK